MKDDEAMKNEEATRDFVGLSHCDSPTAGPRFRLAGQGLIYSVGR